MNHFFALSDVFSWQLLRRTFADDFLWTLLTEAMVVIWAVRQKVKANRAINGFRFPQGDSRRSESGWWILPVLVWGYEAHRNTVEALADASSGLVSPPFSCLVLSTYRIFFALACLVFVQTLGVAATGGRISTLGVTGRARAAATASILAVVTDIFLYLDLYRWFETQASGAI